MLRLLMIRASVHTALTDDEHVIIFFFLNSQGVQISLLRAYSPFKTENKNVYVSNCHLNISSEISIFFGS